MSDFRKKIYEVLKENGLIDPSNGDWLLKHI